MNEFQLEGQMSIFDFPECLPKTEKSNLERVKETIETVAGIRLEENEGKLTWKNGTYTLRIYEGHYKITDDKNGKEFISVGYQSTMEGASCPCDSVEEATARAKSHIDYINLKAKERS